jgi:hypothetical protein
MGVDEERLGQSIVPVQEVDVIGADRVETTAAASMSAFDCGFNRSMQQIG